MHWNSDCLAHTQIHFNMPWHFIHASVSSMAGCVSLSTRISLTLSIQLSQQYRLRILFIFFSFLNCRTIFRCSLSLLCVWFLCFISTFKLRQRRYLYEHILRLHLGNQKKEKKNKTKHEDKNNENMYDKTERETMKKRDAYHASKCILKSKPAALSI